MNSLYIKIALRNIWRNKVFTLINISGLTLGISAALVIFLIVNHEYNYEEFIKDKERIYRVVSNMHFPENDFKNSGVPGPLTLAIDEEIAGIESTARFYTLNNLSVTVESITPQKLEIREQSDLVLTDEKYFELLPHYEWLAGDPTEALSGPGKVVLTESRARDYFRSLHPTEVIGKSITYDGKYEVLVTGVVKDLQEVTDFRFKEFISFHTFLPQLKEQGWEDWGSITSSTNFFIKLGSGSYPDSIETAINALRKRRAPQNDFLPTDHSLQPLADVHFNAEFQGLGKRTGHKPTLYGLMAVAMLLLGLGSINFVNLSTAISPLRAKEIGVRKTIGGTRMQLVNQFMLETGLLTSCATLLAYLLQPGIMRVFRDFIPPELSLRDLSSFSVLGFSLVLTLVVSLVAGFYPAWMLTRYQPVEVFKSYLGSKGHDKVQLRKWLTVGQFIVAQFFVFATLTMSKQIRFVLNKDLGFQQEAKVMIYGDGEEESIYQQQAILYNKLASLAEVEAISLAGTAPADEGLNISTMSYKQDGKSIETSVEIKIADSSYFGLYGLELLAGRYLQNSDTAKEYVINKAFAEFLGYDQPEVLIGKTLNKGRGELPIVGVLKDFNTKPLHSEYKPVVFFAEKRSYPIIHLSLKNNPQHSISQVMTKVEAMWHEVYGQGSFNYAFVDETIANFYLKERQTAKLLSWCTVIAIFIGCLGILGLVIHVTQVRTKEVGIRKVLGASTSQLLHLLSKEFIYLVLIAAVVAMPLSWWSMHRWLDNFAYRTALSWWLFILSSGILLLVALMTLSFNTVRTAIANPVDALRNE